MGCGSMSNKEERLEKKFAIINEALVTGASANALARKYGGNQTLVSKMAS